MFNFLKPIVVAIGLLVAACSTQFTVSDQVFLNCTGYAKALESLAVHKKAGSLSPETIAAVDEVRNIANPVCTGQIDPDNVAAKELLEIQKNIQKLIELNAKESA